MTPFELSLTQHSAVKQFVKYLLLGVSRNSTLERADLQLSSLSGCIKREFMWCYVADPVVFLYISVVKLPLFITLPHLLFL